MYIFVSCCWLIWLTGVMGSNTELCKDSLKYFQEKCKIRSKSPTIEMAIDDKYNYKYFLHKRKNAICIVDSDDTITEYVPMSDPNSFIEKIAIDIHSGMMYMLILNSLNFKFSIYKYNPVLKNTESISLNFMPFFRIRLFYVCTGSVYMIKHEGTAYRYRKGRLGQFSIKLHSFIVDPKGIAHYIKADDLKHVYRVEIQKRIDPDIFESPDDLKFLKFHNMFGAYAMGIDERLYYIDEYSRRMVTASEMLLRKSVPFDRSGTAFGPRNLTYDVMLIALDEKCSAYNEASSSIAQGISNRQNDIIEDIITRDTDTLQENNPKKFTKVFEGRKTIEIELAINEQIIIKLKNESNHVIGTMEKHAFDVHNILIIASTGKEIHPYEQSESHKLGLIKEDFIGEIKPDLKDKSSYTVENATIKSSSEINSPNFQEGMVSKATCSFNYYVTIYFTSLVIILLH